MLYVWNK
jgi:TBC1 domain family protein 5